MILAWLIIIPLIGGAGCLAPGQAEQCLTRWITLAALALDLVLLISLWSESSSRPLPRSWLAELNKPWIPSLGIGIHLALDGLSLVSGRAYAVPRHPLHPLLLDRDPRTRRFLPSEPDGDPRRDHRRVPVPGPVPVLFFLGTDARAHVFPDQHLGT